MLRRLLPITGILLIILSLVSSFVPFVAKASAADSGGTFKNVSYTATMVDRNTIQLTIAGSYTDSAGIVYDLGDASGFYVDGDNTDGHPNFAQGGATKNQVTSGCQSSIDFDNTSDSKYGPTYQDLQSLNPTLNLVLPLPSGSTSNDACSGKFTYNKTLTLGRGQYADALFIQFNNNDILDDRYSELFDSNSADQGNNAFQRTGQTSNDFLKQSSDQCPDLITIDDAFPQTTKGNNATFQDQNNAASGSANPCTKPSDQRFRTLVMPYDAYNQLFGSVPIPDTGGDGGTGGTGGGSGGTGGNNESLGCDYKFTNPLTWIICPAIQLMTRFAAAGDYIITKQLQVNEDKIFCNTPKTQGNTTDLSVCGAYYTAWQSFRNIALGLMVIGGLVMLIAQGLGMEILDAYTLRKVLPRILIGAIGIALSWPLMQVAISVTNDLGIGIRALIYQPFAGLHNTISLTLNGNNGFDFLIGGAGVAAGAAGLVLAPWLIGTGLAALFSLILTAVLAVLVAVMVLVLRQVAITMMVIVAPVAIVAFILPNTQKVYKIWWESFSKALLMFPLIAGMIAAGRVFSAVANSQAATAGNSLDGMFYGFAAFIAYFAPYILIPATFKLAGGAIRQIGGFVNDRSRGTFDRLKAGRAERGKKARERMSQTFRGGEFHNPLAGTRLENRFPGKASQFLVGRANRVGTGVSAGWHGRYGFGGAGQVMGAAGLMEGAEHARKEKAMQKLASSNAFNRFMVLTAKHHGNQGEAYKELKTWYENDRDEYGNRRYTGTALEEKLKEARDGMTAAGGYTAGRAVASYLNMGADKTAIKDLEDSAEIATWVSEGNGSLAYDLVSQVGSISKQGGRATLTASQDNRAALIGATMKKHWGDENGNKDVANYDEIVTAAQMSGIGGETGLARMSNAPSREVRLSVEKASEVLQKYRDDPNSVKFDTAAQAAATIMDMQNTVDTGYGTEDNKIEFNNAMGSEGRRELLDNFLKSKSPKTGQVRAEGPQTYTQSIQGTHDMVEATKTTGEYVKELVGKRYTQLPNEVLAMQDDMARRAQEAAEPPEPPTP